MARLRRPSLRSKQSTPTRQVTGTSYKAAGVDNVKPPNYTEVGSASSTQLVDPIPEVGTASQAARTYLKMVRDDASVRVSLRAGKAPVLGAEWFIEPFSEDPQDLAIAEFVEFNLFNGMTTPWVRTLEQILTFYETGRSIFEPVWELREWAPRRAGTGANRRQYTMLRKLAFRPATTIVKINYDDNGGPVEIVHNAVNAAGATSEVKIPIEKTVIFVFDSQNGSLEGMPILRSAYKHWFYKDTLYKIDAIQKERHGIGVPKIKLLPGYSEADAKLAHSMGANLRTNEFSYIVHPSTMEVDFAEVKGNLVNALDSAEHHDNMIMKNIMVQFLNMGSSGSGGGRATGATAMDMFLKAMRHVSNSITESYNLYLIPNMVAYNFPTDRFPSLRVRGVGETKDMQMFASALRNLADTDLITIDEPTEQWVRQQFDMPRLTTPWTPPSERPERVQELIQVGGKQGGNGTAPATPPTPAPAPATKSGNKSNNGGGGNIGKSPSSGA